MIGNIKRAAILFALCFSIVGCMATPDARYVYQDGQYGVVGIPRNTSIGKKNYREQAHELMIKHFPEGYEIVRAEEVIEGERTLDTARRIELDSEPGVAALNQMIKVGKFAQSTSLDQKDSVKITESRIIYRRKPDGKASGHDGFTALTDIAPELYIDPNQILRKEYKEGTMLAKKISTGSKLEETDKKTVEVKVKETMEKKTEKTDPEVMKASHTESK